MYDSFEGFPVNSALLGLAISKPLSPRCFVGAVCYPVTCAIHSLIGARYWFRSGNRHTMPFIIDRREEDTHTGGQGRNEKLGDGEN